MKSIRNLLAFMIFAGLFGACLKQSEYSVVPQIQLVNFTVKQGAAGKSDTLVATINFKDGDGDIGIGAEDLAGSNSKYVSPWYWVYDTTTNNYGYVIDNNPASLAQYNSHLKFIDYKARNKVFDTLKIPKTFNYVNWQIGPNVGTNRDTIFISYNPAAFTINMILSTRKSATDSYVVYQPWKDPNCNDPTLCNPDVFRYTFPDLSDHRKVSPIEGTFTFKIIYFGFITQFKGLNLKFDITIRDRAGHISNVVPANVNPL